VRGRTRRALVAFVLTAILALGACGSDLGSERGATKQGHYILGLWRASVVVALLVGGLVWGLIVWAVFRYRRRGDGIPTQRQYIVPLEVLYTVVPVVIVAVFFAISYRTQRDVDALSSHPDVVVDVKGFQWQWQFHYRNEDITVTGLPSKHPVMVLPVHSTIRLVLTSPDVIHSFYVPDFLYKRDVIPGVTNKIDVDVREQGRYTGRCAEFCGLDHARMTFEVRAVSRDEYRRWVDEHGAKR
jgi:cytochrome c oxidase subunit 2